MEVTPKTSTEALYHNGPKIGEELRVITCPMSLLNTFLLLFATFGFRVHLVGLAFIKNGGGND